MAYKNNKTEHAFKAFHRDLRDNNFPPIIFMYGEEEYLTEWACVSLADKLVDKTMQPVDFVKLTEEDSADGLLSACNTFSMFSQRRVVWARNFPPLIKKNSKGFGEKEMAKVAEYIENPNPSTILVFSCAEPDESGALTKLLKKQGKTYLFDRLDRPQLAAFAEKRFRSAGIDADKGVIKYLIDETGYFHRDTEYKLFNLENDIKKIIALSEGGKITQKDIDDTVHGDMDRFIFGFLDAVTGDRKDVAFRMLNNIMGRGGEVYSVLAVLINQFELMLEAKELYEMTGNQQKVAETLKMNNYRVKKALSFADKFSPSRLRELLSRLYEIDRNIKTGAIDQNLTLELFIGRM